MKLKNKLGWVLGVFLYLVILFSGCFLIKTDGQLSVLWAVVMVAILGAALEIINMRLHRYTRRRALIDKEKRNSVPPIPTKDSKMEEINRKYEEFHEHITPMEQGLQHLAIVVISAMISITVFQKGPKVYWIIKDFLGLN